MRAPWDGRLSGLSAVLDDPVAGGPSFALLGMFALLRLFHTAVADLSAPAAGFLRVVASTSNRRAGPPALAEQGLRVSFRLAGWT